MREVWEVALLAVVPEGRESAIPWSVVAERAAEKVREVLPDRSFKPETVLRRCQEAAARLRRAKEPVNVVGLSGIGVFIAASPDDLRFRSSQQWRRIRSQIEEARAFDAASADRILAAMGQLGLDLEAA